MADKKMCIFAGHYELVPYFTYLFCQLASFEAASPLPTCLASFLTLATSPHRYTVKTHKKENQSFLIYKEIRKESVAKVLYD